MAQPAQPPVIGWLEKVTIAPPDILLHAKLDTGADNCSVHAENIRKYTKNKVKWVEFELANRYGDRRTLKRKVIRTAKVKKKAGGSQRRPVVRFGLCVGEHFETVECNLVDRSHFSSPVLIGRNFLAGAMLVNSSETYTRNPNCSTESKR